jgi:signal transduction histidine kinase
MRWSIRNQLLVPLFLLLLGIAGISSWTALAAAHRAWQQIETQVRNVARTFCEALFPLNEHVLRQIKGLSGAEYLLVRPDGGQITTLPAPEIPVPPADAVADSWENLSLGQELKVHERLYFCCGVRLLAPTAVTPGTLYILYPQALWRDALWDAVRPSLMLGGFVGLVAVALALGMTQRLSRRLRELGRRTRQIARGDFSPMPLAGRNDELRDLGQAVNDMAQRLAQLQDAAQRNERLRLLGQVSGGLAHQLRNGVTGAILAVQLHARECNNGADPEALDVALRQLALLESNLKRFLDLGREASAEREECSLVRLVDEAVALLRPQCKHAHVDLRWQPPPKTPTMTGDRVQLGHLLLNLLGNAIDAAGPGGWVEVQLHDAAKVTNGESPRCAIDVSDSGPGPPAAIAGHLFEPLVTSKKGGIGLGLAVSRQVAEAHGGTLTWRREQDRTCFRIEVPLA